MDTKSDIERIVSNKSFAEAFRTTIPLIVHLKQRGVEISEEIFKNFMRHILSGNVSGDKKNLEFYCRDCFAYLCQLLGESSAIPTESKTEKPVKTNQVTDQSNEITPEMIAEAEKDLLPYVEPEPSEWFLNLKKQLGVKEEE